MPPRPKSFMAETIEKAMTEKKITVPRLAEKSGVSEYAINGILNSRFNGLPMDSMVALTQALGLSSESLLPKKDFGDKTAEIENEQEEKKNQVQNHSSGPGEECIVQDNQTPLSSKETDTSSESLKVSQKNGCLQDKTETGEAISAAVPPAPEGIQNKAQIDQADTDADLAHAKVPAQPDLSIPEPTIQDVECLWGMLSTKARRQVWQNVTGLLYQQSMQLG